MEYHREYTERRRYPRKKVNLELRIYTSIKRGSYTTKLADISKGGAFIKTPFLPTIGEVISYEILDPFFKILSTGNATVVWTKTQGPIKEHGFGVLFEEELVDNFLKDIDQF